MLRFYTDVQGDPDEPQCRYAEIHVSGFPYKLSKIVNVSTTEQSSVKASQQSITLQCPIL